MIVRCNHAHRHKAGRQLSRSPHDSLAGALLQTAVCRSRRGLG